MKKNLSIRYGAAILVFTSILVLAAACVTHRGPDSGNSNHQGASHHTNSSGSSAPQMQHGGKAMGEMKSSPEAAAAPYDLQFIDTMSAHHQEAINMAKVALEKTSRAELKAFAGKILEDQNREIAQLNSWRGAWFAGKSPALNMEMPGMMESMRGMDMEKMKASAGTEFDLMFLDMMTPHHEGALIMAREALPKAEHQEIKKLAQEIINAQEGEIKQMQSWKNAWSKK